MYEEKETFRGDRREQETRKTLRKMEREAQGKPQLKNHPAIVFFQQRLDNLVEKQKEQSTGNFMKLDDGTIEVVLH